MTTLDETPIQYVTAVAEGEWRVAGSRVSLASIVFAYEQGESPEQITAAFPTLLLEQVHGAIAFYLHHREAIAAQLERQGEHWEEFRREANLRNHALRQQILGRKAQAAQP